MVRGAHRLYKGRVRSDRGHSVLMTAAVRSPTRVRRGSDRGQTGVRPGSDRGQTGVRPGSDRGQTPVSWTTQPTETEAARAHQRHELAHSLSRMLAIRSQVLVMPIVNDDYVSR